MSTIHDLAIIGGGPAGLTAGIYAMRANLSAVLLEGSYLGGQAVTTHKVENYPGFPEPISGPELMERMQRQAEALKLPIQTAEVQGIKPVEQGFDLELKGQSGITSRCVIIASGLHPATLGVPGEDRLRGRGVSYCATCDGAFFRDEHVLVVGGGDSAIDEGLFLARFASQVTIVHRRATLRAQKILQERAFAHPRIKFIWNSVVQEIQGQDKVEQVILKDVNTGETREFTVQGVFCYVGLWPNTGFVKGLVELDEQGFVVTDERLATSVPGIFAAGDVRHKAVRQISTAVGDGATALLMAQKYLEEKGWLG